MLKFLVWSVCLWELPAPLPRRGAGGVASCLPKRLLELSSSKTSGRSSSSSHYTPISSPTPCLLGQLRAARRLSAMQWLYTQARSAEQKRHWVMLTANCLPEYKATRATFMTMTSENIWQFINRKLGTNILLSWGKVLLRPSATPKCTYFHFKHILKFFEQRQVLCSINLVKSIWEIL